MDYEGEIGVIIGKGGFKIKEADAMKHVWGYTIINDMTARERQRDHKQFYIGKSPDTFCPIVSRFRNFDSNRLLILTQGPIAVPAHKLPKVLRVQTRGTSHYLCHVSPADSCGVNGQPRQNSTTEDLIFSIPFLVETLSAGQTIQPGDVIATGTPAGVGFGQKPPTFLKPGDVVEVSVTGLGVLKNTIAETFAMNQTVARVAKEAASHIPISNLDKTCGGVGLTSLNSKHLYYRHTGVSTGPPVIFIHGLGGTSEFYTPLITKLGLEKTNSLHLLDLEGHGLSPTSAASTISISSYASDFHALAQNAKISGATVFAHSMGCLIALTMAIKYPELVEKLVLIGPPPSPVPEAGRNGSIARAATVRSSGMSAVVDAVVTAGTSAKSKTDNLVALAAIRMSLLGQDPEGYAKGCTALAGASDSLVVSHVKARTLIITGDEDKVSPPQICEKYTEEIKGSKLVVLPQVGHWHVMEDLNGVSSAVGSFLQ